MKNCYCEYLPCGEVVANKRCPEHGALSRKVDTAGWASLGDVAIVKMLTTPQTYRVTLDTLEAVAMFNGELRGTNDWSLEKKPNVTDETRERREITK